MTTRQQKEDEQQGGAADTDFEVKPYQTLHFDLIGGEVQDWYGPDEDSIAKDVDYVTQCVKGIIKSKSPLSWLMPSTRGYMSKLVLSKLGQCVVECLKKDLNRVIDEYPSIGKFNRYFGIFYDAVMREVQFKNGSAPFALTAKEEWLDYPDWKEQSTSTLEQFVRHLNNAIEGIRREGNSATFKEWEERLERQPKENEVRLRALIEAAIAKNHHISVLRFDVGYAKYYCDPELSGAAAVTYEEVRQHRQALRRFIKRDLKRHLPNPRACRGMVHAIKMEFGLDKTFHYHVIVVLNGDAVAHDVQIAQLICDWWCKDITLGRGGACNCNARSYKYPGLGSIRYDEESKENVEKLKNLRDRVVPYVTKPDFYVGMVKPEKHRSFWSSQVPEIDAKPKGRRRTKQLWRGFRSSSMSMPIK